VIDLAEAIGLVEATARPLGPRRVALASADGLRLAAAIAADGDSPPWDRAMMDGFAVRDADIVPDGVTELDVVVDLAAGDVTALPIPPGCCARIMTGAPLPAGADAVVPVECALDGTAGTHAGGRVRLRDGRYRAGQHVARRGTAFRRGAVVLPEGTVLTPAAIGLAVEAGATHVVVAAPPRVAILATGSELVPPDSIPAHGQTRNSNGPMIAAAVRAAGGEAVALGSVGDRPEAIRAAVAMGLAADILVLDEREPARLRLRLVDLKPQAPRLGAACPQCLAEERTDLGHVGGVADGEHDGEAAHGRASGEWSTQCSGAPRPAHATTIPPADPPRRARMRR
jgi:molybdopterin molybdotransferase